ncbi:hypothetical protein TOT_020000101 [Theileria orientalis strain Shintoku]|uniref:Transmembrane protein n=1 Tax=Theileria orientalis strain Shintoku TaxID=869250 RepID=J4D6Y7_THEOR|nr:hypothetical protein TOT_020000101 [Theileria orientalis strain Shintoku]BAM39830.1 hypothetical protein TOT_020000101 [Theileria orientalis strain Shintoku]|eukprot:XP_009690131.1 hypothetical protein TOT_020000101 [Theileria orientalis strain Shintoku]
MDSETFERKRYSEDSQSPIHSNLSKVQVLDEEDEEDEGTKRRRLLENNIKLPLIVFFLTFLFPPLGFICFLINKSLNKKSRRYAWFRRALGLGSALSVIYMLIIASVLHHTVLYKHPEDELGYGYE